MSLEEKLAIIRQLYKMTQADNKVKPVEYSFLYEIALSMEVPLEKLEDIFEYEADFQLPKDMQNNPFYEDVIQEVEEFFEKRIEKALRFGIEDIILDTGIGFGKRLEDNLMLIKHQKHFLKFGYELLVGASRKSMIDKIHPSSVEERLPGTLAIHLKAVQNGASIIRVHDVKEHLQAFKVWHAIENTTI